MSRIIFAILACLSVFLFWIKTSYNLDQYLDVFFFDEAFYMSRGIYPSQLINNAENGPLYSLWYSFLNFFENDPVKLYFLNWKIMVLLPSISLLFLLLCYNINVFIATFLSITFMWADATVLQWPRVSNFCISIIAIGIGISNFKNNIYYKFFVFLSTALVASYIRPEYFTSFTILGVGFILFLIYTHKNIPLKVYYGLSLLVVTLLVLKFFYQLPMFEKNGYRSFIAFAQYFAVYYFPLNHINLNPWTEWEPYFRQYFGDANSISSAFVHNPKVFLEMTWFNISFFTNRFYLFMPDFIYPNRIFNLNLVLGNFLLYFILIYAAIFYFKKYNFLSHFDTFKTYKSTIVLVLTFVIPPLIACIIYYPREHYMFLLTIPLILIFSLLFNGNILGIFKNEWKNYGTFLLLFIGLFFLSPETKSYFSQNINQPNVATVKAIRALNIGTKDVNILEQEGGIYAFLDYNIHPASLDSKNEPFNAFIQNNKIEIIWITPNVINHRLIINDTTFSNFIQRPSLYDFNKIDIPNSTNYLLVNKLLIHN